MNSSTTPSPRAVPWRTFVRIAPFALLVLPTHALLAQTSAPAPQEAASPATFKPLASTTIGIEGKVMYRVEAGGPRLIARPVDRFADINVRIAEIIPDGPATLYDLRFIPQRAGRFDLRDALERIDGGPMAELPAAPVAVGAKLDPEHDGELIAMQELAADPRAGYRTAMITLGVAWLLVPLAYAAWRIAHRKPREVVAPPPPPPTLADQLAPLVQGARAGTLDVDGRATLERLVLAYWRKRLNLESRSTRDALIAVKADPKAGQLLNAVERWLHARPLDPNSAEAAARADEAMRLLDAYRDASAIQLDSAQVSTPTPSKATPTRTEPRAAEVGS